MRRDDTRVNSGNQVDEQNWEGRDLWKADRYGRMQLGRRRGEGERARRTNQIGRDESGERGSKGTDQIGKCRGEGKMGRRRGRML